MDYILTKGEISSEEKTLAIALNDGCFIIISSSLWWRK